MAFIATVATVFTYLLAVSFAVWMVLQVVKSK